jgi:hypothetical protein
MELGNVIDLAVANRRPDDMPSLKLGMELGNGLEEKKPFVEPLSLGNGVREWARGKKAFCRAFLMREWSWGMYVIDLAVANRRLNHSFPNCDTGKKKIWATRQQKQQKRELAF